MGFSKATINFIFIMNYQYLFLIIIFILAIVIIAFRSYKSILNHKDNKHKEMRE